MNIIEQCISKLNIEKQRLRRAIVILTVMSLIVALITIWSLRMTGVTIANSASCGLEEHQHIEQCGQNGCSIQEHIHSLSCYSNPSADVETAKDWEKTIVYWR